MKISKPLHKTYTVKMQQKCAYYTLDYKCAGLKELKKTIAVQNKTGRNFLGKTTL